MSEGLENRVYPAHFLLDSDAFLTPGEESDDEETIDKEEKTQEEVSEPVYVGGKLCVWGGGGEVGVHLIEALKCRVHYTLYISTSLLPTNVTKTSTTLQSCTTCTLYLVISYSSYMSLQMHTYYMYMYMYIVHERFGQVHVCTVFSAY